jgi:hypothetical protein
VADAPLCGAFAFNCVGDPTKQSLHTPEAK